MLYIVYEVVSTVSVRYFNLESAAKRSATCMNRKLNSNSKVRYAVADVDTYEKEIVKMKTVKSLMTGKEVEIPSNTPFCCDPSTETYWSM